MASECSQERKSCTSLTSNRKLEMIKLNRMYVLVTQSCPTLCDPMEPGSLVHGILQERILEILFSRGSSQPRDWTQVSHITERFFTIWATWEAQLNRKGISEAEMIWKLGLFCRLAKLRMEIKSLWRRLKVLLQWTHEWWESKIVLYWDGENFSGLVRSKQPPHSLKPKPNPE